MLLSHDAELSLVLSSSVVPGLECSSQVPRYMGHSESKQSPDGSINNSRLLCAMCLLSVLRKELSERRGSWLRDSNQRDAQFSCLDSL